ncbi:MAG: DHH family phosphoesterase [Clostridia bacterium]|nr:DHH family phosphoesterase [Clostridia bacterium]
MKRFFKNNIVVFGILAVSLFTALVTLRYNKAAAFIELAILAALAVFAVVNSLLSMKHTDEMISSLNKAYDFSEKDNLVNFPLPVLVTTASGRILWFNALFSTRVAGELRIVSDDVTQFLSGHSVEDIANSDRIYTDIQDNSYSVYPFPLKIREEDCYALIFSDETQMRKTYYEYLLSRPNVMLFSIDNLDEIEQSYADGDFDAMRSKAEKLIDTWLSEYTCLVRKLGEGRFVVVCEERDLTQMAERKFDILDTIRNYEYEGKAVGITLSIGIGKSSTLREGEQQARQALDMAIGRGGDQAAILRNGDYEFFGGASKGVEKRSKARTRIVASAIQKLMENSSNVLVMGHRFSDLDSIGSAVGMLCAANAAGKTAKIVVNRSQSLAQPLIDAVEESAGNVFCSEAQALKLIDKKTLLIIVDTHRSEVLESTAVYNEAKTVVVIDHHRKNVDFINNSIVFQHDPNASSASEMVAELLQYMPVKPKIAATDATAMLAGVMLDTRNFALKAGVRTFEAAAFLKSKGADTVKARKMFMNKMENFKLRNEIIASAENYKGCAIAYAAIESDDIRTITSQAADELLNIDSVSASFAMFTAGNAINISARSLGEVNVQLIMEKLGGGGHFTMAAAQLADCDRETAQTRLCAAIDEYLNSK